MNFHQIQHSAPQLRAIALESVLQACHALQDPRDKRKWHTSQGVLSLNRTRFFNWTLGTGGGGAIDLVLHLRNCDFKEALHWLQSHWPLHSATSVVAPPLARRPAPSLRLPPSVPANLGRVRRYLSDQRAIDPALLNTLEKSALLYADHRANAVFLLLDQQGKRVGAELRGTTRHPWRGLAPGSRKDRGYFPIGTPPFQAIILCESAIDAISCFALHPNSRCLSTAGARPNPRWLAPLTIQDTPLFCAFDSDATGERMAAAMMKLFPAIQRLRPPHHDWNDTLKAGLLKH